MPWMVVRKFHRWVYAALQLLVLAGAGFSTYWLIRIAMFMFRELKAP